MGKATKKAARAATQQAGLPKAERRAQDKLSKEKANDDKQRQRLGDSYEHTKDGLLEERQRRRCNAAVN